MKPILTAALLASALAAGAAAAEPSAPATKPAAPQTDTEPQRSSPRGQRMHLHREHRAGHGLALAGLRAVDLDAAQKDQLKSLLQAEREAARSRGEARRALQQQFLALDPAAKDHARRSAALADEAARLAREDWQARAALQSRIAAGLTPAQQQQWREARAEHAQQWQERREGRADKTRHRAQPPKAAEAQAR